MIKLITTAFTSLMITGSQILPPAVETDFEDGSPTPISSELSATLRFRQSSLNTQLHAALQGAVDFGVSHIKNRAEGPRGLSDITVDFIGDASESATPHLSTDESYEINWNRDRMTITARSVSGVVYAFSTLSQLVFANGELPSPEGRIIDRPQYRHRGVLIDSGRRFWPLSFLKQTIDAMSAAKLNVLHYHFSDNCRFAIESLTHPEILPEDGQFLSQAQVKDLIRYASVRGVRVVPEIDLPGHARGMRNANGVSWDDPNRVQFSDSPGTRQFLTDILTEFADLFPDHYFHIGADETSGGPTALIQHAIATLGAKGKKVIGWEEAQLLSAAGTPKSLTVQLWKQKKIPDSIGQEGFETIMSHYVRSYMDLRPSIGDLYVTLPDDRNLLGGEVAMWTDVYCPLAECYNTEKPPTVAGHMFSASKDAEFIASINRMLWPKTMVAGAAYWNRKKELNFETIDMHFYRQYFEFHFGIVGCVDIATHRCSELESESPLVGEPVVNRFFPNVEYHPNPRGIGSEEKPISFGIYLIKYTWWMFANAPLVSYFARQGNAFPGGDILVYYVDAYYSTAAFAADTSDIESFLADYRRMSGNLDSTVWFVYDCAGKNDAVLIRHFVRRFRQFNERVNKRVTGKLGIMISTEEIDHRKLMPVVLQEINPIRDATTRFGMLVYSYESESIEYGLREADHVAVLTDGQTKNAIVESARGIVKEHSEGFDASDGATVSFVVSNKITEPAQEIAEALFRNVGRPAVERRNVMSVHGWKNWCSK
jgi:hexosaminidase